MRNLDYIFTVSSHTVASASLDVLANVEKSLNQRSSEPWNHHRLPTVTAPFPAIIDSGEDDSEMEFHRTSDKPLKLKFQRLDSFLQPKDDPNLENLKAVRSLRKKLQQIEMLEVKQSKGYLLDDQQIAKIQSKSVLESSLVELGVHVETLLNKESFPALPEGKGSKKGKLSRKQRRNRKSIAMQTEVEVEPVCIGTEVMSEPGKDMLEIEIMGISDSKVGLFPFSLFLDSINMN